MRTRKKYSNGQPRAPKGTANSADSSRRHKNYHAMEIAYHGSESAYNKWVEGGRKGYSHGDR